MNDDPKRVHYDIAPTPPKAETRKILLRAAEILDGGWCRGLYAKRGPVGVGVVFEPSISQAQPGVDRFCLTGAIMKAVQEYRGLIEAHSGHLGLDPLTGAAYQQMYEAIGGSMDGLTGWNDFVCASGAEAAASVRRAADGLRD